MRPDRFGMSPFRDFQESFARDRDHPFGPYQSTSYLSLFTSWQGLPRLQPGTGGTFTAPTPVFGPAINTSVRVTIEANFSSTSASMVFEVRLAPGWNDSTLPPLNYYTVVSQSGDALGTLAQVNATRPPSPAAFLDTFTEEHYVVVWPQPGGGIVNNARVEIEAIGVWLDWPALKEAAYRNMILLSDFPAAPGTVTTWLLKEDHSVIGFTGTRPRPDPSVALFELDQGSLLEGSWTALTNGYVPTLGASLQLWKRLIYPLQNNAADWVVAGGGSLGPIQEVSCARNFTAEVADPPMIEDAWVMDMPSVPATVRASRYVFPPDAPPPSVDVGGLTPSCAPGFV